MNKSFWRVALLASGAMALAACGNKETKAALDQASNLSRQKSYSDASDVLMRAIEAREEKVRTAAGNPAEPSAVEALKKKIDADSEVLKLERQQVVVYLQWDRTDLAAAAYGYVLAGDPSDDSIYPLLHDPDQGLRKGAAHVLGLVADKSSNLGSTIDALIEATQDPDQDVRRAAVSALGSIKDPRVVAPLVAELKDPYWFARSDAADALGAKNDEHSIAPLLDAVADSDKTVSDSAHDALVAIATSEDDDHKPNTTAKPEDFAPRLNEANAKVVMTAAECLGMLKDPRAIPVLLKLVGSSDPDVRVNAVKGLGESGDRSVLPTLRQTLNDPDLNMRGWSIIGLGKLRDEDSLMDLEHIATDDMQPPAIRQAASASVDEIKSALPPLETP